jgi:hypothetical protein
VRGAGGALTAAAGRATAHASVTAAVADHDRAAGVAAGCIAHVKVFLHGVGRVEDCPAGGPFKPCFGLSGVVDGRKLTSCLGV